MNFHLVPGHIWQPAAIGDHLDGRKTTNKSQIAGDMSRAEEELSRRLKAFLGFGNGTLFLQENAEWSALTQPVPCWHSKLERDTILSWAWPSCYVIWQRV